MKLDDIYQKCAEFCQVELPPDIGNGDINKVIEVQSKVRKGLIFCGTFIPLAHQKMGEAKQKYFAAKSEASKIVEDLLKQGTYKEQIKSFTERKELIVSEANNKCDVFSAEADVEKFKHLYQALKDTADNLKSCKEQLSTILSTLKEEMGLARSGGAYTTTQDVEFDKVKL